MDATPRKSLELARHHCVLMRELIVASLGGRDDNFALGELQRHLNAIQTAVDDADCRHVALRIADFGADLFSAAGHQKWAHGEVSGADVLRLNILRNVQALESRLSALEAMR